MKSVLFTFTVLFILMTTQAFASAPISQAGPLYSCANEDKSITLDFAQTEIFEDEDLTKAKLTDRIDISVLKRSDAPYVEGAGFSISRMDHLTQVLDQKQNKVVLLFVEAELNSEERKHYDRKITILRSECARQTLGTAGTAPMTVFCKKVSRDL